MKKKFHLNSYQKWLGIFLITVSTLGVVYKSISAVDNRYAKSQNVAQMADMIQKVSERLDYEILTDQIESKQERIWSLEDRFIKTKEKALQDEIRKLKQEIEKLEKERDKTEKPEKKEIP